MLKQKRGRTNGEPPSLVVPGTEPGTMKVLKNRKSNIIMRANIQENLLWSSHLETGEKALLPLIRKQLGRLRHLGRNIPLKSRNNLVRGLIISRHSYLMPLWGNADESHIRKAQVLLNTAARWATGLNWRTRTKDLMKTAGWMNIRELIKMSTSVFTWKIVHLAKPARLAQNMTVDTDWKIQTTVLQFCRNCLRWKAGGMWNELPQECRQETSIARFKILTRQHILQGRNWDPGD